MKIQVSILMLMVLFFGACQEMSQNTQAGKYKIEGTVAYAKDKPLYLELLTLKGATVIDTAMINMEGQFKMLGKTEEAGLYRLRLDNEKSWLLVLGQDKLNVSLNAMDLNIYTIKGSDAAVEAHETYMLFNNVSRELAQMEQQIQMLQVQGAAPMQVEAAVKALQNRSAEVEQQVLAVSDSAENIFVAFYANSSLNSQRYAERQNAFLKRMEQEIPNSVYTQEWKERLIAINQQLEAQKAQEQAQANTSVGALAPDIELKGPDGKTRKLSDLRGKLVLLDFWASWCMPCRAENPHVVALYDRYKSKGFEVFSVSLDKRHNKWVNAIAKDNLYWDGHVSDLKGWKAGPAKAYGVNSIPATFLIDAEGKIIAKNLRGGALAQRVGQELGS